MNQISAFDIPLNKETKPKIYHCDFVKFYVTFELGRKL